MNTRSFVARFLSLAAVVLALAATGCASASIVRVGNVVYPPLPPGTPIAVYYDDRSIGRPFQIVGEVEVENPGKWQELSVNQAIPQLTELARRLGANGVIVDGTEVIVSGIISRGFAGRGRAIRVFDAAPGSLPPGAVVPPVFPTSATVVVAPPAST